MKKCPQCGRVYSDNVTQCSVCRRDLSGNTGNIENTGYQTSSHITHAANNAQSTNNTISTNNTTSTSTHTSTNVGMQTGGTSGIPNDIINENIVDQTDTTHNVTPRKTKSNGIAITLAICFASAAVFLSFALLDSYDKVKTYKNELSKYRNLANQSQEYEEKADFLDTYIVFTTDEKIYHTYDCSEWDPSSFVAGNVDLFDASGLEPCSDCIGN